MGGLGGRGKSGDEVDAGRLLAMKECFVDIGALISVKISILSCSERFGIASFAD